MWRALNSSAARKKLAEAGYGGEPIVVTAPNELAGIRALSLVGADQLRRADLRSICRRWSSASSPSDGPASRRRTRGDVFFIIDRLIPNIHPFGPPMTDALRNCGKPGSNGRRAARLPVGLLRPDADHAGRQPGGAYPAGSKRAVFNRAVRTLSAFGAGAGGGWVATQLRYGGSSDTRVSGLTSSELVDLLSDHCRSAAQRRPFRNAQSIVARPWAGVRPFRHSIPRRSFAD